MKQNEDGKREEAAEKRRMEKNMKGKKKNKKKDEFKEGDRNENKWKKKAR